MPTHTETIEVNVMVTLYVELLEKSVKLLDEGGKKISETQVTNRRSQQQLLRFECFPSHVFISVDQTITRSHCGTTVVSGDPPQAQ